MQILSIDIETYSSIDIKKSGAYAYAQAPDFTVLMLAYDYKGARKIIDLAQGEEIPPWLIDAIKDKDILKSAFNANFERVCLSRHLGLKLQPEGWRCTSVKSAVFGLPHDLGRVASILKLPVQKDSTGKELIKYFSVPCKPTKTNGGRTRNLPEHNPEAWEQFKDYCLQDVEVEVAVGRKLDNLHITTFEEKLWCLDQKINDVGMKIDKSFVQSARAVDAHFQEVYKQEMLEITGMSTPKSIPQLKAFFNGRGHNLTSVDKDALKSLNVEQSDPLAHRVIQLRQFLSKTSTKKYDAMMNSCIAHQDDRVKGLLQFYGASRTGRWAGRIVQIQNLPKNKIEDLEIAREMVRERDIEGLEMLYKNVPDLLSQLIRTAFIAKEGFLYVVADFSAIEARVLSWLANENWRLEVFRTHGKIYEASASKMFGVPLEEVTKGSDLRSKGKIAELALGYQGGVGALKQMGAESMGLADDELSVIVNAWRKANSNINKYWYDVERGVKEAIAGFPNQLGTLRIYVKDNKLFITLPSGRSLIYREPFVKIDGSRENITFMGMNQTTRQWERQETYGGKLVENITQAVARDCLAEAMVKLQHYIIVGHVHDEVILEVPENTAEDVLKDACSVMGEPLSWAPDMPLGAEGYITPFYMKD